jgi:hypothetical protein
VFKTMTFSFRLPDFRPLAASVDMRPLLHCKNALHV